MNDSKEKVIDVDFSGAKQKERRKAHKRVLLLVIACLAAVALAVGTVIFFQLSEVVDEKSFWQNFNSQHSERG